MARRWASVLFLSMSLASASLGQEVDVPRVALELDGWIAQVRPELERLLGRALPAMPRPALGETTADIRDIRAHLAWRFPHLDEAGFKTAVEDTRAVSAQAALASLEEGTNQIVLECTNAGKMARWHPSLERLNSDHVLKLAVLHEMARYALDARFGLGALRRTCRDAEEWFAMQAVVEGRAAWLTAKLARQLNLQDSLPLLTQRYLYVPDGSPDPALRTMSQSFVRQKHWACTQGLAFWSYLEARGQADEERVFANPPRQVRCITQPELYLRAVQSNRPSLAAVLTSLEALMPGDAWAALQQPWTPAMLMQVAGLLEEKERAEKVAQGWDEGRSLIWTHKSDPSCQIALSVVRYESIAGARGYFGFALDLQRKRDELSNQPCGLPLRVVESRPGTVSLAGVNETIFFEKKMQVPGSQQTIAASILLVRQGERVIELTWYGQTADLAWAQRVLEALGR